MDRSIKLSLVPIFVALLVNAASAQTPRNVVTKKNTPVALTSLLNTKPDCTAGPIDIPVVKQPPAHGAVPQSYEQNSALLTFPISAALAPLERRQSSRCSTLREPILCRRGYIASRSRPRR